jgi:hypothetical protein
MLAQGFQSQGVAGSITLHHEQQTNRALAIDNHNACERAQLVTRFKEEIATTFGMMHYYQSCDQSYGTFPSMVALRF